MRAVQILMDDDLIRDVDLAAKTRKSDRSKLVREALRHYLVEERRRSKEEEHRRAYERQPLDLAELEDWVAIQAWPEE